MGIALLTLSNLFQGLTSARPSSAGGRSQSRANTVCTTRRACAPVQAPREPRERPPTLRVLRVCDSHNATGDIGRLVISGRMADVCAELDRLAAKEAAEQARAQAC